MRKKFLMFTAVILAFASFSVFVRSQDANATPDINITICHRGDNTKQPYGPKSSSVDRDSIVKDSGHSEHTGKLASSEAVAEAIKHDGKKWGDIIPPFQYVDSSHHKQDFPGLNYNTIGQAMLANNCQYVLTTPSPVTFTDPTCDVNGTYTIPVTTGIDYKIDGNVIASGTYNNIANGGSVTVIAVAKTGYTINSSATASWSHSFTAPDEDICHPDVTVVPEAVSFVDPTCETDGTYTIPSTVGVKYYIDDSEVLAGEYSIDEDTTLTINAVAEDGYVIDGATTKEWSHSFEIPTIDECVQGVASVTPAPVVFTASTCDTLGYYTITGTTGVEYYVDGQVVAAGKHTVANGKTVVVTAVADTELGYEIKEGATNQWSYTFTAKTDCVLGASTDEPSVLPETSGDSTAVGLTLLTVISGFVVSLGAIARRIFARQI